MPTEAGEIGEEERSGDLLPPEIPLATTRYWSFGRTSTTADESASGQSSRQEP